MKYTRTQLQAIGAVDEHLQIIACAGSGKTQVISARIVEILKRKQPAGITPANIVAFTFTEKAAGELKDRIYQISQDELGTTQGLAEMFVGTIHGYCLNLLQSPPLYRYLKYDVLTDVRQRLFIDRHSQQCGLAQTPLLRGGHLERWKDSRLYQDLLAILGEGDVDLSQVPPAVLAARDEYLQLCKSRGHLDYTMILSEAVDALRNTPALRERIAAQVKYLVVDEYQDVNPLQEALIRDIHDLGANICVVGDDDQTIYQWRGSDAGNILRFADRYPGCRQIALNENFRSNQGVVEAARQMIESNPVRLPKRMESTDAQPYQRGDLLALAFSDPQEEAQWIARKIQALYGTEYRDKPDEAPRGLTYADFAVLLRSVRRDGDPITQSFEAAGIPYVVGGMNKLFDTREIQAMRSVFFFLADFALPAMPLVTPGKLFTILDTAALGLTAEQITGGIELLKERKAKIGGGMDATLYLQRVYLDFLTRIGLREEAVNQANPHAARTGEIIYFNLGKFSQVITDFEQINFHTNPASLYTQFASFLYYQAPDYYPEGWEDAAYSKPDAVQVMTVHQAKGMQWPAVFVPCLRRNRFPSRRQGGRTVWHVIPEASVANADRYKGTEEDERRLFYVALTRAERYLFASWAPMADNCQQRKVSEFFNQLTGSQYVLTREPITVVPAQQPPKPRKEDNTLALTFSELKYYFTCPYQFKLRFLFGFDAPISRALGYGKSLHDALAEIHAESLRGHIPEPAEVPQLVERHLHLPFANQDVQDYLQEAAHEVLTRYLQEHRRELAKLEHVEKVIELKLEDGIVVNGRIDLIRRTDTDEVVVVDFKSDERAQAESVSQKQLHVYAAGYEQLTGKNPDLIEIHNLDKGGSLREMVDRTLIEDTLGMIHHAGNQLRQNNLPRLPCWEKACSDCEHAGICRTKPSGVS